LDGVGDVQGDVRVRVGRVAQRGLEPRIDLDDVDMRGVLREVLGEHAEAAPDLEHHVVGTELGRAPYHPEQVRVDQEVLAQVAARADAEGLQAAQARLRRELAHQPNRRAAFASTACSSSAYAMPRRSAMKRAVCTTKAVWLRCLRTGCGVRYGASVSTRRRSSGTRSAAEASS